MPIASRVRSVLRNLLHPQRVELELDTELRAYLELLTDEKVAEGLEPREARRAALAQCGGLEQVKQSVREQRLGISIAIFWQEARYALWGFRRNPLFTLSVVAVLALGIGSTTAMFSVVDPILFRALPYTHASRLVSVGVVQSLEGQEFTLGGFYNDWVHDQRPFSAMASQGASPRACDLVENSPILLNCITMQAGFLPMLGIAPVLGRNFLPDEERPNGPSVALISWDVWHSDFGADAGVLNRLVDIGGRRVRIVGVLPRYFELPTLQHADIFLPLPLIQAGQPQALPGIPMRTFGRLRPGVSVAQARAEMEPLFRHTQQTLIPPSVRNDFHLSVRSLRDREMQEVRLPSRLLLGAVLAMLLIACGNVAALMMARAAARAHEAAIRMALGASRARLLRQSLTESMLLAFLGALVGMALAAGLLRIFIRLAPSGVPFLAGAHLDPRVTAFALLLALGCAAAAGWMPAMDRHVQLTADGRNAGAPRQSALRRALVVGQIAISLVLLSGATLMLRSLAGMEAQPLGIRTHRLVTAEFVLPRSRFNSAEKREQFYLRAEQLLRGMPGMRTLAWTDSLPPGGWHDTRRISDLSVEGRAQEPSFSRIIVARHVTPGYFQALAIPLLRGRSFTDADQDSGQPLVVINRLLADRLFPNSGAVGQRVRSIKGESWFQIVGVAQDTTNDGLAHPPAPEMDFLILNTPASWARKIPVGGDMSGGAPMLVIDSVLPPAAIESWVRSQIASMDSSVPVRFETMTRRVRGLTVRPRFETALLSFFAGSGLLLAVIGLYGTTAYLVTERTREIGVRIAVGATRGDILQLILAEAGRLVILGCVVGLALSFCLARLLSSLLFHVSAYDPTSFLLATAGLSVAALLAAVIPARLATRVDPAIALRSE